MGRNRAHHTQEALPLHRPELPTALGAVSSGAAVLFAALHERTLPPVVSTCHIHMQARLTSVGLERLRDADCGRVYEGSSTYSSAVLLRSHWFGYLIIGCAVGLSAMREPDRDVCLFLTVVAVRCESLQL